MYLEINKDWTINQVDGSLLLPSCTIRTIDVIKKFMILELVIEETQDLQKHLNLTSDLSCSLAKDGMCFVGGSKFVNEVRLFGTIFLAEERN